MSKKRAFEEIGHSGGKVVAHVEEHAGRTRYSVQYSNSNPVPLKLVMLYALPQGIPVERVGGGYGLGVPFEPPTYPDSLLVPLASDREGMFGRTCPHCRGYWRASDGPQQESGFCPYCGRTPMGSITVTERQHFYVAAVCQLISKAVSSGPGSYALDLDDIPKDPKDPATQAFYLEDERQQTHRACLACGSGQDVLGRASYCCACGTRNDREILAEDLAKARDRARAGELEGALRDTVSALDGFIAAIAEQLVSRVPLSRARKNYWSGERPRHRLAATVETLDRDFGFSISNTLKPGELRLAAKMVARRHLHEHKRGVVDQDYLNETHDAVRLGQHLVEEPDEIHALIGLAGKIGTAVMDGFHELFAPDATAIATGEKYGKVARARQAAGDRASEGK